MYSPHIGQSQSVDRSMQRWESAIEMDMHTQQVCRKVSRWFSGQVVEGRKETHVTVVKVLSQSPPNSADAAVIAVVDTLLVVVVP